MFFGCAWYPEQWLEKRWQEDIQLMVEAGMNVCRVAEFAWSSMEPREGDFQLEWLDRVITLLHQNNIKVVLGTPTAAPPAWLTRHHPDTLAIEPDGRAAVHGNRCHASPASHTYLKYCRKIVEQMAKRYGPDSRIIGWQIDNEYNRIDYSDNSRRLFQSYLRDQYSSLESLNQAWSTAYWSQTYQAWDEIPLPAGAHNPGLMLAFRRFVTQVWRDFQHSHIEVIRTYSLPEQWICSNFMGWFDGFDHYQICSDLDMASWDWYIGTGRHDYLTSSAAHDLTRGFKRKNFWVMETQPGCVNWSGVNNSLNRGEARCMAFHAAAHGAEALLYWQWRSAPGGQEQMHGSLVAADGSPRPFYIEAQEIGKDFALIAPAIQGTAPQNEVCILHSYEARWSVNWQRHHKDFDPVSYLLSFSRPLAARNIGTDILSSEEPLDGFKLVIAPALVLLTQEAAERLQTYVKRGGVLILTPRCGQKNRENALFSSLQPGPLREIAGAEVSEFYALEGDVKVHSETFGSGSARIWAESLRPIDPDTQILARYGAGDGWLDDCAAITWKPDSSGGGVLYIGCWLDDEMQGLILEWALKMTDIHSLCPGAPAGVEAAKRTGQNGSSLYFLINHTREEQTVTLNGEMPASAADILTENIYTDTVTLKPYGIVALKP